MKRQRRDEHENEYGHDYRSRDDRPILPGTLAALAIAALLVVGLFVAMESSFLRSGDDLAAAPPPEVARNDLAVARIAECNRRAAEVAGDVDPAGDPAASQAFDGSLAGLNDEYRHSPAARSAYRDCMQQTQAG